MYRGPSQFYKVVQSKQDQYAVWHADAFLVWEWRDTGCYGSENECWDYIEDQEGEQGLILQFYSDT